MSDGTFPSPKTHYTQTEYTVKGKASDFDEKGNLKEGRRQYCLRHIRNSLSDFKEEKTEIEYLMIEISKLSNVKFTVRFTPKYHCELSGEGIEYTWGLVKRWFRALRKAERDTIARFRESIKRLFENKLEIDVIRKFSRKARAYMLVYAGMKHNSLTQSEIKIRYKCYRCHRDISKSHGEMIFET